MSRTSEKDVRAIIDDDTNISMAVFIETASVVVDYVDSCDTGNTLSAKQLRLIETWLAAHFYAHRDQQYSRKQTEKAEAWFQVGVPGVGSFDTTHWGRTALGLDTTGCLAELEQQVRRGKQSVDFAWGGKAPSNQTDYVGRD